MTRLSLRFKVSVLVLLLVVPIFFFLYYTNIYSRNIVREKVSSYASDTLALHLSTLDELLEQTSAYLIRTANENLLLELYSVSDPNSVSYYVALRKLMDQWYNDVSYYSIIRTVFVYHQQRDELYLSSNHEYYQERDAIRADLSSQLETFKLPTSMKWEIVTVGGEPALYKAVPDRSGRLLAGILVSIDALAQPLTQLESTRSGERIGIVSDSSELLWGEFDSADLTGILGLLNDQTHSRGSILRLGDGENYLVLGRQSLFSPLQVFILLDEKSLLDELLLFERVIQFIPLAVIVLLAVLLALLSRLVFRPIHSLMSGMRLLGKGQLDYRLKEEKSSEFQMITQQFNWMAEQIGDLKIGVYEEQMKVQQAELKHLQAQINPHFFMNSLNIVYQLVELKQLGLSQKMLSHLVSYFRFIMNTNDAWIPLLSEVNHIRNYIEIQMVMYPGKLTFHEQLPQELEGMLVPPLLVQPFVENAMKHGFVSNAKPFELGLSAERVIVEEGTEQVAIRVRDSGPGFTLEQLDMLNRGAYEREPTDRQLGIWNVRRRLAMAYEGKAQLTFDNHPQGGARVELILPVHRGGGG
ncbi:sensor histidine kinase [Paenibacillus sp. SYP-B4298]|uniref:sensor histidine kinase n=1 Tax=Paenibacillus sp. SYP-B4298 TaxID=2996034 RepID=UPI0022DE70E7|nr:histidine kinase [Paenibacillus sp. SYP-B4298]